MAGSNMGLDPDVKKLIVIDDFEFHSLKKTGPDILFAGQNIGEDYMAELLEVLNGRNYGIIVISKSDAETIEKTAERHWFMKQCRVVIVLDQ